MKYALLLYAFFILKGLSHKESCNRLPSGKYLVHFTTGPLEDYRLRITDSYFVQYLNNHDSASGKINWISECTFKMEFFKKDKDTVCGPLKLLYDSWGEPCIELNEVKGDTIKFRTTYPRKIHITVNEGYFLGIPLSGSSSISR